VLFAQKVLDFSKNARVGNRLSSGFRRGSAASRISVSPLPEAAALGHWAGCEELLHGREIAGSELGQESRDLLRLVGGALHDREQAPFDLAQGRLGS
jgi:hypothetical protein